MRPAPKLLMRNMLGWGGNWFDDPAYANFGAIADFNRNQYAIPTTLLAGIAGATAAQLKVKRAATFNEWFAFTASSTAARSYIDSSGTWKFDKAANSPRLDYRNGKSQLRLEDARTQHASVTDWNDYIAPNNFSVGGIDTNAAGTTTTFTKGTENGLEYIDMRIVGTYTNGQYWNFYFGIGPVGGIVTSDVVVSSIYTKLISGSWTPLSYMILSANQMNAAGAYLAGIAGATGDYFVTASPLGTRRRNYVTGTADNALVSRIGLSMYAEFTGAGSIDTIFRIYAPQTEKGVFPTDYIKNSGYGAVTRAIETAEWSPLMAACAQRSAGSFVARADVDYALQQQPIIGFNNGSERIGLNSGGFPVWWNGVADLLPLSGPVMSAPMGMAGGFDGSGRSFAALGATLATDAGGPGTWTRVFLGTVGGAGFFSNGMYDLIAWSPDRLSNATLQALAVAAS